MSSPHVDSHDYVPDHRVAVVAMSCRFPGATTLAEYEDLIRSGREGLTRLDAQALRRAQVPTAVSRRPGYVPVSGILPDPTAIDAAALGLSETEAELMDPQQRVFLECAAEALESACLATPDRRGTVGVFAGQSLSSYLIDNLRDRFHPRGGDDPVDSLFLHGLNVADYLPQRTARVLGLTGPTLAVGATCATSLVAIHLAVNSLLSHECDTALAGGVTLRLPQDQGYLSVPDGPFSSDGHTRAYGAEATGTVFTQGAGVVVLRRLSDALADGDDIYAVVLGSAIGNDGPDSVAFSAPSVRGQARVIAEAQAVADVAPDQIGLIEGHGTGTALGDPIEVRALNEVFGHAEQPWCALGSVKSLIGHTDAAAGVAGFIKAALAVSGGYLPPTAHAQTPNPNLPLEHSALRLSTELRPWEAPRRIAGVSSFGIGGVNSHLILEAPPQPKPTAHRPTVADSHVTLLSAADREALRQRTEDVQHLLASEDEPARLASAFAHGARRHPWRGALVSNGRGEVTIAAPPVSAPSTPPQLIFAFPGGGAQFPGMAADLYRSEPDFTRSLDRLANLFSAETGCDPRDIAVANAVANQPGTGLPALFAVEVAMAQLLESYGLRPDVLLGHSVGEYAAAVIAGALSEADACRLVAERSRLMQTLPPGSMVTVALPTTEVAELLAAHPGIDLAAVNAPQLCVLAGAQADIAALESDLQRRGVEHHRVDVAVAAHSRHVEPVMAQLRQLVDTFPPQRPHRTMISTLDGDLVTGPLEPEHWVRHLRGTVRMDRALDTATALGDSLLIQPGPGASLASIATGEGIRDRLTTFATASEATTAGAGRRALLECLGQAWSHGIELDLDRLVPRQPGRRVPTYPWQRRRYALPHLLGATRAQREASGPQPSPDNPLQLPSWRRDRPARRQPLRTKRLALLADWAEHTSLATAARQRFAHITSEVEEETDIVMMVSNPADPTDVAGELKRWQRLAQSFAATGARPLLHVTCAAEAVTGGEEINPAATAASGLPRVLAQEFAGTRWRTLDLETAPITEAACDAVLDELADLHSDLDEAAKASHVAIRGTHRWTRRWESWTPEDTSEQTSVEAPWIITGGFGNVGLALARRLREKSPHTPVILLGRTLPAPDDPRWERWCDLKGPNVEAHQVDVAQPGALGEVLHDISGRHGSLGVIVHAPVSIDLAPLADLDEAAITAALAPKVRGAVELAQAIDAAHTKPDRVILMSSAAGTIGGFGLGAYVAAGRFLDGLACSRGWLSVNWDRIRLGTAQEENTASEVSLRHAIDIDDVVDLLLRLPTLPWNGYLAASPTELNTRSRALDITRRAGVNGTGGEPSPLDDPAQQLIAAIWSEVLGREVRSAEDDFFALGGHSLLATRVLALLRERHGIELRLRDLLSSSTVSACAGLIDVSEIAAVEVQSTASPSTATPLDRFGLTRVQHAYWIGRTRGVDPSRSGEQGVGCHFYLEYDCPQLDVERYENAWRRVIERHPMMRTVITASGEHRLLDPPPHFELSVDDLREHCATEAETRLESIRARLSTRVADPARWPLIHPQVVLLPGGRARLLLSVDVLVCDSASWMLIDRELCTLYRDPDTSLPPVPTTFAACVAADAARSESPRYRAAKEYWTKRVPTLPEGPPIASTEATGRPHFTRLAAQIPAQRWQYLRQQAAAQRVTPTALVLNRYCEALANWSGRRHFSVTLTVFDRPPVPGVERVVGEFSSMIVHEANLGEDTARQWEAVRATQDRLADDLDHRLYSGLEVLTDWSRSRGKSSNVPVVFTSMLGLDRLGGDQPHDHEWLGSQVDGISQTPQVWLDHQAFEHRGALVLQWDVCDSVLDLDAARAHFERYVAALAEDEPTETNSDQPQPGTVGAAVDSARQPASTEAISEGETSIPTEETLKSLWAEVLNLDEADIGDHSFLALGGDSLMAVRMAAELRRRTGFVLPLTQVRADVTINELAALMRGNTDSSTEVPLVRREDPFAPFGLLPLQQAYFVGQSGAWDISYETAHVSTDIEAVTEGSFDADTIASALRLATERLWRHHPMLRAQILPDGTQRIRPESDTSWRTPVEVHDLTALADPAERLEQIRSHWASCGPDPRHECGVRVGFSILSAQRGRLHIASSLLIMDGWSNGLYFRELLAQLNEPTSLGAPFDIDFGDYVASVTAPDQQRAQEADRQWWNERLEDLPAAPALPRQRHISEVKNEQMTMREFRLTPDKWQRLRQMCQRFEVTPASALLTVFTLALNDVTGQQRMLLNTLQHNRLPLHEDVDSMIGPFSRTALLPVELSEADFVSLCERIGEQQRVCDEHRRVSAVDIGRQMARRGGRTSSVAPVVFQSTIGMDAALGGSPTNQAGVLGRVDDATYDQRLRTPQVELELRTYDIQGHLVISLASVDELFGDGVAQTISHTIHERLQALLNEEEWTVTQTLATEPNPRWDSPKDLEPTPSQPRQGNEPIAAETLAQVSAVWTRLLDLEEQPGPKADFFALGGDSLLAVRMVGALRRDLGIDVDMRRFLREPTLQELCRDAQAVEGFAAAAASTVEMTHLRKGLFELRSGTGRPVFLLHPSGGDILCYVELSRLLETSRPILAIGDPGLEGHAMPTAIPALAECYRRLIADVQPQGPWTIGGWSMGGTVAHEVARLIHAGHGAVDRLLMIDSNSPERIVALAGLDAQATEEQQRLRQLRSTEAFLGLDMGPHQDWRSLAQALVKANAAASVEALEERFAVFSRHLRGLADHHAGVLPASIESVLLRASVTSPRNSGQGMGVDDADDPQLGWSAWIPGPLTVVDIDAHHYSILRDPAVAHVAKILSRAL
ncbi:type I polyketide synthase [Natronoglycomyces albus]|uniref:SDR family NAD(P)-dependent oxidoreductase n=1 Tax=Natronoglycomyces albus TaxID=2811108 RepID=A0A895XTN5_9ACTN|nr:type I polyketide synthase [Natronoglycomyces albus]QSB06675.1 SDR family NAD(P)-dependent oxidoreductase [Natronoglycomyces albus]